MPYLVALTGPYTGQAFEIREGRTTVGRGPGCDLVLARDGAVSRAHAVLTRTGGAVEVQDAGSTHGVHVNGRGVPQASLRVGDCVQFGASAFLVQPVPAQVSDPPRLRMRLPRRPGVGAPAEPGVSPVAGCLLVVLTLLLPVPAGLMIAFTHLARSHPGSRRFGGACLLLSLLSVAVQGAIAWRLIQQVIMPLLNPGSGLGL